MASPQKDNWIDEITRLRASALPWQNEAEAARLRENPEGLTERV